MSAYFTNEPIDLDQLPKYETVQLSKPHTNYWRVIVINILIYLVLLGCGISALLIIDADLRKPIFYIIGAYLILVIFLFMLYRASFNKRGYAMREKDIIYKSGIIAETTTIIPFNRIQHVALDEGVFSRIFKLGKLQIYTAGGSSGHLVIAGLEIEKARKIREMLLRKLIQIDENQEIDHESKL